MLTVGVKLDRAVAIFSVHHKDALLRSLLHFEDEDALDLLDILCTILSTKQLPSDLYSLCIKVI